MNDKITTIKELNNRLIELDVNTTSFMGAIEHIDQNELIIDFRGVGSVSISHRMNEVFQTFKIGDVESFYIEKVIGKNDNTRYILKVIDKDCTTFSNLISDIDARKMIINNELILLDLNRYYSAIEILTPNSDIMLIRVGVVDQEYLKQGELKLKVKEKKVSTKHIPKAVKSVYRNNSIEERNRVNNAFFSMIAQ